MPIPGFRVPYPENDALKEIYCDFLKKDGIEGGFASLKNKVDTFSLPGDFRKIVNKPKGMFEVIDNRYFMNWVLRVD